MKLLFTDETNLPTDHRAKFFAYGGLILGTEQLAAMHDGIAEIRRAAGYRPGDELKLHTSSRPEMNRLIAIVAAAFTLAGCGSTIPKRSPEGEVFPKVEGKSLAGQEVVLPDAFRGGEVILVMAYEQETQVDVDRWGIGFFTADLPLPPVYEIPTIPGVILTLFKGGIDEGMRKGIPRESWKDVITVYGSDVGKLTAWTGTENPRNARVVLLDEEGRGSGFTMKDTASPLFRISLKRWRNADPHGGRAHRPPHPSLSIGEDSPTPEVLPYTPPFLYISQGRNDANAQGTSDRPGAEKGNCEGSVCVGSLDEGMGGRLCGEARGRMGSLSDRLCRELLFSHST